MGPSVNLIGSAVLVRAELREERTERDRGCAKSTEDKLRQPEKPSKQTQRDFIQSQPGPPACPCHEKPVLHFHVLEEARRENTYEETPILVGNMNLD